MKRNQKQFLDEEDKQEDQVLAKLLIKFKNLAVIIEKIFFEDIGYPLFIFILIFSFFFPFIISRINELCHLFDIEISQFNKPPIKFLLEGILFQIYN